MTRSIRAPAGLFDSLQYGFAQVAVIATPLGREVHVSGQVAWDADGNIVGRDDIGRQLEKSLENLATALASAGANLDQVGALRLYIKQSHIQRRQGDQRRSQARRSATTALHDLDRRAEPREARTS